MDNILKYLIQLKADGGNMRAVARETLDELDKIDKSARNVGKSFRQAFSFGSFKESLMSIPGMQFLTNPYILIGAGIGAITKLGSEAEMTSVSFRKLVGDEQKAADTLKQIKEFANRTPYESMDLIESAKQMLSFGVSTEKTVDVLKRLGDISQGDANTLKGLSLVYSQVSSQGVMQGQDWHQFINAGFNPLQELSEMTGKTMGELQEMMSKGQIGAKAVSAAIEHATNEGGKFYKTSEDLAGTTSGKFSTLISMIKDYAASAFEAIQPLINSIIDMAMDALNAIKPFIKGLIETANWVRENIGFVTALAGAVGALAIGASAMVIKAKLLTAALTAWKVVQMGLNVVMSLNPIGLIVGGIAAATIAVAACWKKFAGFRAFIITMWDTIKDFAKIIQDYLINRFIDLLDGIGDVAKALKALFAGDFKGAWESAKSSYGKLTGANAIGEAVAKSHNTINGFGAAYNSNLKKEQAKDAKEKKSSKISTPTLLGSRKDDYSNIFENSKNGKGAKSKDASAIATGGQRNTSITMNIGKFFDTLQVTMMDKTDTADLETIVVQSLNRALAIATSTDR